MKRPYGMAQPQFEAYLKACAMAGVEADRIAQTIGNAAASAGTHAKDGTLNGIPYSAATDFRIHDLSTSKIKKFVNALAANDYPGWFRHTGSFENNQHVHAVFAGVSMKEMLCNQIVDYVNGRTGLVGHEQEQFYTAPPEYDRAIARAFKQSNPIFWAANIDRIPNPYRNDDPPKLLINGAVVVGAYLINGAWWASEGALSSILGGLTQTPSLIAPVRQKLSQWGWTIVKYNPRLDTMGRADILAVKA